MVPGMPHAPEVDVGPYSSMTWWMLTGGLLPDGA